MNRRSRPIQISHVGIQTYNIHALRDWYLKLLDGEVVFERLPLFCTITFDDEHHRIALLGLDGEAEPRRNRAAGLFHTAFTLPSIFDLLGNYERVRDLGIAPEIVLHHGPIVSMYYRDPDGSQVELVVDRFKTGAEAKAFMNGPVFAQTLGAGGHFDAETMLARMKAGASEEELLHYDEEAAMSIDPVAEIEQSLKLGDKAEVT